MAPMDNSTWYFVDSTANNYTYKVVAPARQLAEITAPRRAAVRTTPLVPTWVDKDGNPIEKPKREKGPLAWLDGRVNELTGPARERIRLGY